MHSECTVNFVLPWLFSLGSNGSFSGVEVVIEVFLVFNLMMFISTVPVKEQRVPSLCLPVSLANNPLLLFGKRMQELYSWCNRQASALSASSEKQH